MSEMLILKCC